MSKLFSDFQMSCWTVFKCPVDKILECTLFHQKDILQNLLEDSFSKVFGGKYFPGNHLKNSLRILPWGSFLENNLKSSLREFFGKPPQISPEWLFWKTSSNLPWGTFMEKDLISSLMENNIKSSLMDFFWFIRTWYLPWGRGRRTFWPLISGIGSGLLVLLKINWLQSWI